MDFGGHITISCRTNPISFEMVLTIFPFFQRHVVCEYQYFHVYRIELFQHLPELSHTHCLALQPGGRLMVAASSVESAAPHGGGTMCDPTHNP